MSVYISHFPLLSVMLNIKQGKFVCGEVLLHINFVFYTTIENFNCVIYDHMSEVAVYDMSFYLIYVVLKLQ